MGSIPPCFGRMFKLKVSVTVDDHESQSRDYMRRDANIKSKPNFNFHGEPLDNSMDNLQNE